MGNAIPKIISLALMLSFLAAPVFIFGMSENVYAQSSKAKSSKRKRRRNRDRGQDAVVIVDGSAVYKAQNFDAPVMEYLDRGKKVKISQRVYPGIGGLGTFYKVRLRKGVYGYITDVDIEISGKTGVENTRQQMNNNNEVSNDPLKIQKDLETSRDVPDFGTSIYLTRFLGGSYSSVNYTETIAGSKESSTEGMIGLKISGPGKYMGGMPLDFEVKLLTSAPAFYDDFASSSSGYMLMSHAYAMFPFLLDKPTQVFYYQFGPTLKYTAFDVKLAKQGLNVDSQEISLGVGAGVGYAIRLGNKWALRLDAVFQKEAEAYLDLSLAVQVRY